MKKLGRPLGDGETPKYREVYKAAEIYKPELISMISEDLDITEERVEKIVNSFLKMIKKSVASRKSIAITGFGTFQANFRESRLTKNPKTGVIAPSRERVFVVFRPGKDMKF
ncbi:MAG: HU family DNA-binding protein [Saprospiraceae bacterium]